MFRKGCCIPGGSFMPQGVKSVETPLDIMKTGCAVAQRNGYDFAEATIGLIMNLSEKELAEAVDAKLILEVANSFIPNTLPICQTMRDEPKKMAEFVGEAMRRMNLLHCGMVIFGSGGARNIPEGMERAEAERYLDQFLILCNKLAEPYGITVALEPLNQKESNYLNRVSEGYALAKRLNLPHIKLLADAYHMAMMEESPDVLKEVDELLVHVHICDEDRHYPGNNGGAYLKKFAKALASTRYSGSVSVECGFRDFAAESAAAFGFVKEVF